MVRASFLIFVRCQEVCSWQHPQNGYLNEHLTKILREGDRQHRQSNVKMRIYEYLYGTYERKTMRAPTVE